MGDFLATFHIEGRLLLAQFVNFAVVFVLIYFCVLKPLSKLMGDRTAKIEKGLEDAQKAETALFEAKNEKERIIVEGHQESKQILLDAESKKEAIVESAKVEAETEAHKLKTAAIKEIEVLKEHQSNEIKKKSVGLVVSGVEKVLRAKMDDKKSQDFIEGLINS